MKNIDKAKTEAREAKKATTKERNKAKREEALKVSGALFAIKQQQAREAAAIRNAATVEEATATITTLEAKLAANEAKLAKTKSNLTRAKLEATRGNLEARLAKVSRLLIFPEKLFKTGNDKIDESVLISVLPTSICKQRCPGCYAYKSERRYPAALPARERFLAYTLLPGFVEEAILQIKESKRQTFRIHESGDIYSQQYLNSWVAIITACDNVRFYTHTKNYDDLDFSKLLQCNNFNLVDSMTPIGYNFGNSKHCAKLVNEYDYKLCPCSDKDSDKDGKICGKSCFLCRNEKKVCFLKH